MTVVAIDGPAGAGKSTVARLVADKIGVPYLDTGAMYRCVALSVLDSGISLDDVDSISAIAQAIKISVANGSVSLNGVDVSQRIREPEVGSVVSTIAAMSPVRDAMRSQQQVWISTQGGGVVEGRDIGTVVFPNADVKIFLTASPMERASRRVEQSGGDISLVAAEIEQRDHIDAHREDSPMKPAADSVLVDSTGQSIDTVVDVIVGIVQKAREGQHG